MVVPGEQIFEFPSQVKGETREYEVHVSDNGCKFRFKDANTLGHPLYISDFLGDRGQVKK